MFGFELIDVIAIAAYLVGITLLGIRMGKTVHDSQDFFVGGRRFGKLLAIFSVFGTGTHSDQAVSVVSKTYSSGMSGIWYQWLYLFVTPFNWWIAPILRRSRAITTADYFEARYDRGVATLYVAIGMLNMMVTIGLMLKGAGRVIEAAAGGQVSEGYAIAAMTIMFVIYNVVGGLAAAIVTDFFQGLLTIFFSFILLPFALIKLGGFVGLHDGVARAVEIAQQNSTGGYVPGVEEMWSLVAPGEIGWFYLIVIVINGLLGLVVQPHAMPISGAVKSEKEAQIGSVYGSLMKRVCTVAWTMLGMCAVALYPGLTDHGDIDQMFGKLAHDLLPQAMPGLMGIFIASLLASIMAACGAFMLTCSALFTHNIYRPFIAPRASQGHYVGVGRIAAFLTVACGVIYAFMLESVIKGVEQFWIVSAMMAIPFWIGLFWRRATAAAAWASTLVACAIWYVTEQEWFIFWAKNHAAWILFGDKIYLPTQMTIYLVVGFTVMVVVSLLTKRQDPRKLDLFYDTLRTPIQPGERVLESLRLPPGVEPAPQRKLIDHPDLEIQIPTRRGINGFLLAWLLVVALIAGVMLLVRIGA
ncbi:MAG TPA: sodium:solute symporter family protein [Phycisphaerae bacterium]|nr:sodium:solute symporter family protein [Phycisphaerae bacterium]